MNERHRRRRPDRSRDQQYERQRREGSWRDRQRSRFPDEPYGGEREGRTYWSGNATQFRGPSEGYGERERGYGTDDTSSYRPQQPGRRGENYQRIEDYRWSGGGRVEPEFDGEHDRARERNRDDERWRRDRAHGGFGSQYGAWSAGAGFGFGPEEDPRGAEYAHGSMYGQGDLNSARMGRGDWEDTDWMPNRPARGRGTWAGDWEMGAGGAGEYGPQSQPGPRGRDRGSRPGEPRGEYAGRGPRDYRRSDDRIREEVCDRLTDDPYVDASDVSIRVDGGEVMLTGFVASREQKRRAEECAERISGVREVINQLRVARSEAGATATGPAAQPGTGTRSQRAVAADRERT